MRFCILLILIFSATGLSTMAETELFHLCPLCTKEGLIICPSGFEAACANEVLGDTEPKCVFYQDKYVPGCWKFVGVKKLDFNFGALEKMFPTAMINIIGGGETYTLNREIVGCRKL